MVLVVKNLAAKWRGHKRLKFDPWVRKIPWRGKWQPLQCSTQENPVDRGAWHALGHKESDTTEVTWHTDTHTSQ